MIARAIGIITSPGATFQTVIAHPRPVPILGLVCIVIALATALPQFTERGKQATLDMQVQQIEKFTGRPVTPEVYTQMEGRMKYTPYFSLAGTFVAFPVITLLITLVFFVIFNAIMGGTATFKQILGVVTHSQVIGALGVVVGMPIMLAKGTMTTSGPFNLGALAPFLEPNSFLSNFLGGIDIFRIWGIVVTAIGLGLLYRRKPRNIAIGLFVVYAVFIAIFAYVPTMMGR